jgi:hypothetical protein
MSHSVGYTTLWDNRRILTLPGFWTVILSDEVAAATEESKDPYVAHPLSPGVILDGVSWGKLGSPSGTAQPPIQPAGRHKNSPARKSWASWEKLGSPLRDGTC